MKPKEVLVIGGGIAGYAAALAIAKKKIPVTVVASPAERRIYHSSCIGPAGSEPSFNEIRAADRQNGCMRAREQLIRFSAKNIEELLGPGTISERQGNIDVHKFLEEQLKQMPDIEWMKQHTVIELLTLENHSVRKSDIYKKATCLGVYVYNHETRQVEELLAKETIIATGGAVSLYPYSTNAVEARGTGLAMAHRAGARLLHPERIQFHPICLYTSDKPCIPLPVDLLREGGRIYTSSNKLLEDLTIDDTLSEQLYKELFTSKSNGLWLDMTMLDPVRMQEKFPSVDSKCLAYGYNAAKDRIPIVPAAQYTGGGIKVDPVCRTTVQRLRAIGEVSCTGVLYDCNDEAAVVSESITWAMACAEDIAKQLSRFVYYFPEIRKWTRPTDLSFRQSPEDWHTMGQIMWHYAGIVRDEQRLKKGCALLQKLKECNHAEDDKTFSIDRMYLHNALETAIMIAEGALKQAK